MKSSRFKSFIGIDQTGAVLQNGSVKKLPCTIVDLYKGKKRARTNIFLSGLYPDAFLEIVPYERLIDSFILVDSVLGIPAENTINMPLRKLFKKANAYQFEGKKYGASVAHRFFNEVVLNARDDQLLPTRHAERLTKANSIFKLKPFQKNIGCGTFRVWKDLDVDQNWYTIWPFENQEASKAFIAEGYPSFLWKTFIKSPRGDEKGLLKFAKSRGISIDFGGYSSFFSVDSMDSFVLALFAAFENSQILLIPPSKSVVKKEGWIFGLTSY